MSADSLLLCVSTGVANQKPIVREKVDTVLGIAKSPSTHWRYAVVALRILRTLIRRDQPLHTEQMKYFLEMIRDPHPSLVSGLSAW